MSWLRFISPLLRRRTRTAGDVRDCSMAFKSVFRSPSGAVAFNDLTHFCWAFQSTYHDSQRASDIAEGRRQVWLHIMQNMELTDDELIGLASGKYPITQSSKV